MDNKKITLNDLKEEKQTIEEAVVETVSEEVVKATVETVAEVIEETVVELKEETVEVVTKEEKETTIVKINNLEYSDFLADIEDSIEDDVALSKVDEEAKKLKEEEDRKINYSNFKETVNNTIIKKVDINKLKFADRNINIKDIRQPEQSSATSVLYNSGKVITMSEMTGLEIQKLNVAENAKYKSSMSAYVDALGVMYKHITMDNKPATVEDWAKSIQYLDLDDMYFAVYKACFANTNNVPHACPHCSHLFLEKHPIESMYKFSSDKVKDKYDNILSNPNTDEEYPVDLISISDKYVVGIKLPSIYNATFEMAALPDKLKDKFADIVALMIFIDSFYIVEGEEMVQINEEIDPSSLGNTVKKRLNIYGNLFTNLIDSDAQSTLQKYIREIQDENEKRIEYILPATTCPECKKEIDDVVMSPQELLFTRHQLVRTANSLR